MRRPLCLVIAILVLTAPAIAQTPEDGLPSDPFERIQELARRRDQARQQKTGLAAEIEKVDVRLRELQKIVDELQPRVDALTKEREIKEQELSVTVAAQDEAEASAERARIRLDATRARVRNRMVSLYKGGPAAFIDALLASHDVVDVRLRVDYVTSVMQSDRELTEATKVAEGDYRAEVAKLEKVRVRQKEARDQVAAVEAELQTQLDGQKRARDDVAAEREVKHQLLAQAEQVEAEFNAVLAQERADLLRVSGLLQRAQSGQPIPAEVVEGLLVPPAIGEVVSGFGYRVHPIFGSSRFHAGIDMAVPYGDPIHAAASGTVVDAGWMGGYGNAVLIDHGNGIGTLYAHMSELAVGAGQGVATGEVVGFCGSTGYSTGPHLHFEVHVGGQPTDPLPWLA